MAEVGRESAAIARKTVERSMFLLVRRSRIYDQEVSCTDVEEDYLFAWVDSKGLGVINSKRCAICVRSKEDGHEREYSISIRCLARPWKR